MPTLGKARAVFSIDLATRRYADFGMAYLPAGSMQVSIIPPSDIGLDGEPMVAPLAAALDAFCIREGVGVLLLDGPQGWRHPESQIEHMRLCERVLNTPGKTGTVGNVKPRTYQRYIQFSIDLFAALREQHGWELLARRWTRRRSARWLVESFPSAAWTTLGLQKLPGKSKTKRKQIDRWARDLATMTGMELPSKLTHDQLQAAVVLPAGRAIAENNPEQIVLAGIDPLISEQGEVLEGLIANPRLAGPHSERT